MPNYDRQGKRVMQTAMDIMGESDGHVVMPPRPGYVTTDSMMEIRVKNNAHNPLTDIVTTLPRYCPPGKPPKMNRLGLEGSCMPNRAVPHDRQMFGNAGRLPCDNDILCQSCMPTDNQLFGHMKADAPKELQRVKGIGNRPATPRGPRVGRARRN